MPLVVNGEAVDAAVLAREAEGLRQRFQQLSTEDKRRYGLNAGNLRQTAVEWARENVIEQTLLRQAALEGSEPLPAAAVQEAFQEVLQRAGGAEKFAEAGGDQERARADLAARLKVDRLIAAVTARAKPPKPKDLQEFYRRNKERFRTEETVRAAHIVKHVEKGVAEDEAREAAEALHAQLRSGRSFEELADQQSDCPGNGGDLGYFPRGQMVPRFEEVVFGLRVGEVSEVFRTEFGFHIAKLLDRKPKGLRPFAEVKRAIQTELLEQRRSKLLEAYVDRLRESATIEASPDPAAATASTEAG